MVKLTVEDCMSERSPGRLIRTAQRHVVAFAERQFATGDVSFVQWLALKVIMDGCGRTAGELARDLMMTSGAVTRLIDSLECRGLLTRMRDANDRRVVRLSETSLGSTMVHEMATLLTASWNDVLDEFDDAEYAQFNRSLIRLLASFDRQDEPARSRNRV